MRFLVVQNQNRCISPPHVSIPADRAGNNFQAKGLSDLEHEITSKALGEAHLDPESHAALLEKDHTEELDTCQSKTWIMGTVIFISGSLLNFASYSFAAQSLLACLEAVQFVTNIAFGKFLLKAKVTTKQYVGTTIIIFTVLVCIWFAGKGTLTKNIPEMIELFGKWPFVVYTIFCGATVVFLYKTHMTYQIAADRGKPFPLSSQVLQYSYATGFALFGTMSVVLAKCMAEILEVWEFDPSRFDYDGKNIWAHWFWYSIVVGWLCFMSVWLYGLNNALGKYNPVFIIPLLQINFILFAIVSGGIFFEEFGSFCAPQFVGFGLGVVGSFYGLFLLIPEEHGEEDDDDESIEPPVPGSRATQLSIASTTSSTRPSMARRGSVATSISLGVGAGGKRASISLPHITSMATLHQHHNHHKRRVSTKLRRQSQAMMRTSLEQDINDIRSQLGPDGETELSEAPTDRALPDVIPESVSGELASTDEGEDSDAPKTETRTGVDTIKNDKQSV